MIRVELLTVAWASGRAPGVPGRRRSEKWRLCFLRSLKPGTYDLTLGIGAPDVMRIEGAMDKWLAPVQVKFAIKVK